MINTSVESHLLMLLLVREEFLIEIETAGVLP